ncbi:hypothetical protein ACG2LH_14490 [Zhouia sp. PK063]|uniref:hypothetical protein n=1 Tax=Zhouia sp. PK063 TaxID=3373602 RepID=UPI0037917297
MKNKNRKVLKIINVVFFLSGAIILFFFDIKKIQNMYLVALGFFLLMFSIYNISKTIPSKSVKDQNIENSENNEL